MARHNGLLGDLRHAAQHPERARRYLRRLARNTLLWSGHRDHLSFYGAVVAGALGRGEEMAVGHSERPEWDAIGRLQFDYLVGHGLCPHHRLLEIGCGNLRAGRLFIGYLGTANYYGLDISPPALFAAQATVARYQLATKMPYLALVKDMHFAFLPDRAFDFVHAHSVFSHSPLPVIEECLANVARVMKPGAVFDFTFNRTEGREYSRLREDFYFRTATLVGAAQRHGLRAELMDDWERGPHPQSRIRITLVTGTTS
jgi:SAM-dependent methyltransferase